MQEQTRRPQPFPWRIFLRTFAVQLLILLGALAASGLLARSFFKSRTLAQLEKQLEASLQIASHTVTTTTPEQWCKLSASGTHYRVTQLKMDGTVLCDSHHSAETMENHADRPEISDAIGTGQGLAIRHSATIGVDMLYVAKTSEEGEQILRFAIPLSDLNGSLRDFDRALVLALLTIGLMLAAGEIWIAHVFVQPIRSLLLRAEVALSTQESGLTISELGRSAWGEWEHLDGVIETLRQELKTKIETLKREKNEQAVIMESISDAILVVNDMEQIVFANERFRFLFPGADMEGQNIRELRRDPVLLDLLTDVMKTQTRGQVNSLGLDTALGYRYFALAASPLIHAGAITYGAVAVFHDITELKLAEKMRIDFVANVSHEMRTPLTAIKGYASTVLADLNNGMAVSIDLVEPIVRNSERMVRIVSDLLDLSTLDANPSLQIETLDCSEITSKVGASFVPILAEKMQEMVIEPTDLQLQADPVRLEQVLTNLIDNASKYTPNGGTLEVHWLDLPNEIVLAVKDNGPGIEETHLPRLFERFYRIDKGRSRNQGGTGLGLAIVKHIMLAHSGHIAVESTVGAGSTFLCHFPKKRIQLP